MEPAEAVSRQRLIVVCGPGGVGKTTTSAAFGLAAARAGRRALVLTIDPAKRLGESLGQESLGNEPQRVPSDLVFPEGGGRGGGELWALMLHQEETADTLINRSASSDETARRILENRIYKTLARALASTEYMAVERLHQLSSDGKFDLFVLDTPPSKNALDFLDSPQWASRVLDQRIIHWFLRTAHRLEGEERGVAGRLMYRTAMIVADLLGRLLGREFYEELVEFFDAFADIADALKSHADEVDGLLRSSSTTFYVTTSPEQGAVEEAIRLARELRHRGFGFGGFVANRVEREIVVPARGDVLGWLEKIGVPEPRRGELIEALEMTWRDLVAIRRRDEEALRQLSHAAGAGAVLHPVPRLGDDLKGTGDLLRFASRLMERSDLSS